MQTIRKFLRPSKDRDAAGSKAVSDALKFSSNVDAITESLAAQVAGLKARNEALVKALTQCVAVAKSWHNMDVKDGSPMDVWQLYYDNAPEMKLIRAALAQSAKVEA